MIGGDERGRPRGAWLWWWATHASPRPDRRVQEAVKHTRAATLPQTVPALVGASVPPSSRASPVPRIHSDECRGEAHARL